jgi:hypothetical protein
MEYTGNLIHRFGLSKSHMDQMTGDERIDLIRRLREYATHLNVSLLITIENEGEEGETLWFEETHPKLDGVLMGYLVCLGFDENGIRNHV